MVKKISRFIKGNYKFLIGVIVGLLLSGTGVYAANTIYSKNVTYDNSSSGLSSVNVQDALDELYLKMYPSQFYKKLYESAVRDDKSSTYVSSSDGIDFSKVSSDTNGKGLYIASEYSDYKYPILYYRGDVDNNNLIFANFCWKIVRTTETGGIKLIYNGVPSNGTCDNIGEDSQIGTSAFNTNYNSPAYLGYMYGTPYTYNSKSISSFNGTYYYGNNVTYSGGTYTLTDTISASSFPNVYDITSHHYTCMGGTTCTSVYYIYYTTNSTMYYIILTGGKTVEDAVWCSNRIIQESGWNRYGSIIHSLRFMTYTNVHISNTPNLRCNRYIDKFTVSSSNGNGNLDYPVGLLKADEVMFAGGTGINIDNNYYLKTGQTWWSLSPATADHTAGYVTYLITIYYNGRIINTNVNNGGIGVRPSISLASDVEVSGGNGTINSPYVVG